MKSPTVKVRNAIATARVTSNPSSWNYNTLGAIEELAKLVDELSNKQCSERLTELVEEINGTHLEVLRRLRRLEERVLEEE